MFRFRIHKCPSYNFKFYKFELGNHDYKLEKPICLSSFEKIEFELTLLFIFCILNLWQMTNNEQTLTSLYVVVLNNIAEPNM